MTPEDSILLVESSDAAILARENFAAFAGNELSGAQHLGVWSLTWGLAKADVE